MQIQYELLRTTSKRIFESYIWNSRQIKNSWKISPYTYKQLVRKSLSLIYQRNDRRTQNTLCSGKFATVTRQFIATAESYHLARVNYKCNQAANISVVKMSRSPCITFYDSLLTSSVITLSRLMRFVNKVLILRLERSIGFTNFALFLESVNWHIFFRLDAYVWVRVSYCRGLVYLTFVYW